MRVLLAERKMNVADLRTLLLSARLAKSGSDAAIEALRTLNPHVADLDSIPAGTALLVPEGPGFKVSATASTIGDVLDGFRELLAKSTDAATQNTKRGNDARGSERDAVAAAMRTAAVKRAIDADLESNVALHDPKFFPQLA